MSYALGIDLGTTNSVVCVSRFGSINTIPIEGKPVIPSAISIKPEGKVLVGQAAKARSLIDPSNSITSAKRWIGDGKTTWEIHGKVYSPVDVSSYVLKRIKEVSEDYLGTKVNEAVITVPAYFNNNQKNETRLAAVQAGFKVLQLLAEPTAAAISYGLDKGKDQTIMVYDLGGGTFDVSLLTVKGNKFDVIAVDGDSELGGDDFDLAVVEYFIDHLGLKKKFSKAVQNKGLVSLQSIDHELLKVWQKLKEAAQKAKIELSESDLTKVMVPNVFEDTLDVNLSLATYNKLIEHLVDRTIQKVQAVLKEARLKSTDIDRVILVGGSTRNKLIRQKIAHTIKEPYISENVDEVVAQGAAIVAGYLSLPEEDNLPIEFRDVTPFDLGVRATKGDDDDFFKVLIGRNSTLPQKAQYMFTTIHENQKNVDIEIFQGKEKHCEKNIFIGGFRLGGIPPAPVGKNNTITITFNMNTSDLLDVTAICKNIREEKTLDINIVGKRENLTLTNPMVDIIFWIDTSGSMSNELSGVQGSCLKFAERVIQAGMDCRLGLLDFDCNIVQDYKWELFGPMEPNDFSKAIKKLKIGRLGGLGCYIGGRNTVSVTNAFVQSFIGNEREKIGILISDEVGDDRKIEKEIINILKKNQVCLHVVGVPNSCHVRIAKETGGFFWNINKTRKVDFSKLLNDIAVEITNIRMK